MERKFTPGVYPTMITPYRQDGSVDIETAEKYADWYFSKNCAGIFALCQSSEVWFLSLQERLALNKAVYNRAKQLEKQSGRSFTVVTSGHTAESIEQQAYELEKIYETGSDAMILISNRLDIANEGDDVWLKNAEKLLKLLPADIKLGVYECPYPYKRLLTAGILNWCKETDRFYFLKDTCCNIETIKERLDILRGSNLSLMNANAQTLLESLKYGASGYSSVMSNFHPELYVWLCNNANDKKAVQLQNFLGTVAFTEGGLPYPLSAKYNMCLEGIPTQNISRVRESSELTEYAKDCIVQMKSLSHSFRQLIGI